jgi:DNA-binding response OmpR family regulator
MNNARVLLIDAGAAPSMQGGDNTGRLEQFCFTQKPTLSEGLDALQKSHFHLVLLNLSLSDASAADSITKILEVAPDLPVIALVSKGETAKAAEALRLGVDDYLLKGLHCNYLTWTMRHAIERKQLMADRKQAWQSLTKADAQLTPHSSHEVQNALACIQLFGTIMLDGLAGNVSEEQRKYLCIMLKNASIIRSALDSAVEGTHLTLLTNGVET